MARDLTRHVRQAVIAALQADATDIVPAARWFPQQVPSSPDWPYGFVGVPITVPDSADCLQGSIVTFAVHGYARTATQPGETTANMIGESVSAALDGRTISLTDATCDLSWISSTTIRDGNETSQFHVIVQMRADVSA